MFNEIKNLQREVFELSFKKGWYELEKALDNKISEKYNTLNPNNNIVAPKGVCYCLAVKKNL